jgi:hypothetical protein
MTGNRHLSRFASQRPLEIAIGALSAAYILYVLVLTKMLSPSVSLPWYRDLGILWDNADYVVSHRSYAAGYFFPPSCYILAHLFGLLDHRIAFRIYLVVQIIAIGAVIWAWARLIGVARSPSRSLIILTAALACSFYIHVQLGMHNPNAETFALVSLALAWSRSTALSTGCYALSLAIKPYSSVFVLPWMAWNGNRGWALGALLWLMVFFVALPALWFGLSDAIDLHRQWLASLLSASENGDPNQLSVRGGLAALAGGAESDLWIRVTAILLELGWLGALAVFFVPALWRRGPPAAMAGACEAAAILLIGLPLGSHQQPARMVVLLAAALVIAAAIFEGRLPTRTRALLVGILAVIGVAAWVVPIGPIYFLATLPICVLALLGLALVRDAGVRRQAGEAGADPNPEPETVRPSLAQDAAR